MADDLEHAVARWAAGWAAVRRMAPPQRDGSAWVVDPLSPERARELVVGEPTVAELEHAVGRVRGSRDVWLTRFTSEAVAGAAPTGLVVVRDAEVLMRFSLDPARSPGSTGATGSATLEPDGDRASATVWLDGRPAARGWVAVVGTYAVVDRVETHESYRRRGLGSEVVRSLQGWAQERGATTGLLAATTSGQALYTRLGWEVLARMTTWSGVSDA